VKEEKKKMKTAMYYFLAVVAMSIATGCDDLESTQQIEAQADEAAANIVEWKAPAVPVEEKQGCQTEGRPCDSMPTIQAEPEERRPPLDPHFRVAAELKAEREEFTDDDRYFVAPLSRQIDVDHVVRLQQDYEQRAQELEERLSGQQLDDERAELKQQMFDEAE
jgi:hypothetical protein